MIHRVSGSGLQASYFFAVGHVQLCASASASQDFDGSGLYSVKRREDASF